LELERKSIDETPKIQNSTFNFVPRVVMVPDLRCS